VQSCLPWSWDRETCRLNDSSLGKPVTFPVPWLAQLYVGCWMSAWKKTKDVGKQPMVSQWLAAVPLGPLLDVGCLGILEVNDILLYVCKALMFPSKMSQPEDFAVSRWTVLSRWNGRCKPLSCSARGKRQTQLKVAQGCCVRYHLDLLTFLGVSFPCIQKHCNPPTCHRKGVHCESLWPTWYYA